MKLDQAITNPGGAARGANPEYLNAQRELSTEQECALEQAEHLLQRRRFELVMSMTAQRFVKLSHAEKRNYCRWAKHFAKVFCEKESLFERHSPADIDLPTFLTRINP